VGGRGQGDDHLIDRFLSNDVQKRLRAAEPAKGANAGVGLVRVVIQEANDTIAQFWSGHDRAHDRAPTLSRPYDQYSIHTQTSTVPVVLHGVLDGPADPDEHQRRNAGVGEDEARVVARSGQEHNDDRRRDAHDDASKGNDEVLKETAPSSGTIRTLHPMHDHQDEG